MLRYIFIVSATAALSACSSPTPSPYTEADFEAAQAEAARIASSPLTAVADIPTTGTADYSGQLGAEVNGDIYGAILGNLDVTANFATGDIDGTVSSIGFDDWDGDADQLLDGSLVVSGSITDSTLLAGATGSLGAVDEDGFSGSSTVMLYLDGDFHSDSAAADSIYGTVGGSGSGDYDVTVSSGEFYATQ